ncbi:IPT/TIG domain-containing protein [Streptomyces sp. NPDC006512]|uniref:IPT/TIG domain-containing protein n=1 Tax=Streptomyces sp. NPDC006512 TaxID=3154307 RepID=UPI0033BC844F
MTRTLRRAAILLAAVSLFALAPARAAPPAAAAGDGPAGCPAAPGTRHPGPPDTGTPQGQLVSVTPDIGPRSGGTTVSLAGSGLTGHTRVVFGTLDADGCFTGVDATAVAVIGDSLILAITPAWPTAAQVLVAAATPDGRLTNPLPFTYGD